jgi:hypothetical protein
MNALMRSARRPNPIQWVQKKNQTSSRIEYGGDTDRISDVEEVLESGGIEVEKTGDLSIPMMAPSDLPTFEEGGADGIDAATLTSKSIP